MTNKIIFIVAILFLSWTISCKTRRLDDKIFSREEFVNFKLLDSSDFKFLHYKLDSIITVKYCEGRFIKQGNTYTIFPKNIQNKDFACVFKQTQIPDLTGKTRIKIQTDIVGDYLNHYQILIKFDNDNLVFSGVNIDTTINEKILTKHVEVEVSIPDRLKNSYPTRSFTSISTSRTEVNTYSNFLYFKIPVTYQTFLYQNPGVIQIQDDGNYWLFLKDKIKIKKGYAML